jgi:hypothetical protein
MAFKRPNNFTFKPSDELLDSMLMHNNEPFTQVAAAATRLAKLIEKIHYIDVDREMENLQVWIECPFQKLTQVYLQELSEIESAFSTSVDANSEFYTSFIHIWFPNQRNQKSKYRFFGNSPELNYTP